MKLFFVFLLFALFSCKQSNFSTGEKEPTIVLTQSFLMVIYENGYLKGIKNCQNYVDEETSQETWKLDSIELTTRFFKK